MAIWYEVEKTESDMKDFMECSWDFHDFKIERIAYAPEQDQIELFLMYDELCGSVILRFLGVKNFRIAPRNEEKGTYEIDGALLILGEDNTLVWLADDSYPPREMEKIKKYATWIEADRIIWAVTNSKGEPDEMPKEKIDQEWNIYGEKLEKHFELKEYTEG